MNLYYTVIFLSNPCGELGSWGIMHGRGLVSHPDWDHKSGDFDTKQPEQKYSGATFYSILKLKWCQELSCYAKEMHFRHRLTMGTRGTSWDSLIYSECTCVSARAWIRQRNVKCPTLLCSLGTLAPVCRLQCTLPVQCALWYGGCALFMLPCALCLGSCALLIVHSAPCTVPAVQCALLHQQFTDWPHLVQPV